MQNYNIIIYQLVEKQTSFCQSYYHIQIFLFYKPQWKDQDRVSNQVKSDKVNLLYSI